MNLNVLDGAILDNKLDEFLKDKYEEYTSKNDEIKKKEIIDIINKNHDSKNYEKIKIKMDLLKDLNISSFIDNNVIVGKNLIENILPKIESRFVISDQNVMKSFNNYFDKDDVFLMDSVSGTLLKKVISRLNNDNNSFLIGIGGGRVMDYLKYIMMETGKFCVAIPSSLATHVYVSPKITILPAIADLGYEKTIDGPVPDLAILDIGFLENLYKENPRLIRAGLGDLMACITALEDWRLAEENNTTKINYSVFDMTNYIIKTLEKIDVEKPLSTWIEDYVFIQVLLCRISGWVGSAPVSGSEHLFASAVEQDFNILPIHGELVALGTIIMSYIQGKDYNLVCSFAKRLGLPTSLSEIGLSVEQTIDALVKSKEIGIKKGRFTVLNKFETDKDSCGDILDRLLIERIINR